MLDTSALQPGQVYNMSPAAMQPQTTDAGPEAPPWSAYNLADHFNDGSSGSANRSQSSDGDQATVAPYLAQSSLADAQPFEYHPDDLSGDATELAASTNKPRYAAKMLGYDQHTFSDMLHRFKPENGLRGDDNVIFHDDGSVEFNKRILDDNIHDYAP
ncbi:hypothetical protein [Caballeronia temeraria]|uniref:hypothetical protein n=1 Tax=Caballeronia temeraria TaxID=1777137 RepID=UPI0012FD120D|nr:hypothetical protein [Caballeronia temeraria]